METPTSVGRSDEEDDGKEPEQELPEIKARIDGHKALLKILCEKRKGILVKVLEQVDKVNLSVVNASVAPFGTSILDITVVAQMEEGLEVEENEIVAAIRTALQQDDTS